MATDFFSIFSGTEGKDIVTGLIVGFIIGAVGKVFYRQIGK